MLLRGCSHTPNPLRLNHVVYAERSGPLVGLLILEKGGPSTEAGHHVARTRIAIEALGRRHDVPGANRQGR
jgi:hypothetical protein